MPRQKNCPLPAICANASWRNSNACRVHVIQHHLLLSVQLLQFSASAHWQMCWTVPSSRLRLLSIWTNILSKSRKTVGARAYETMVRAFLIDPIIDITCCFLGISTADGPDSTTDICWWTAENQCFALVPHRCRLWWNAQDETTADQLPDYTW